MNLNKYIDHTLLKPEATKAQIIKLCQEAKEFNFATVCVNPYWVSLAQEQLKNTEIGITTVIGFPLGANSKTVKAFETSEALKMGATEIDMVMNIGALKSQQFDVVLEDMKAVKAAAPNNVVKVILETCLLTQDEIIKACQLALEAKLDFVKTSTGFSTAGATLENVKLMKQTVKNQAKVKAAGGVRNLDDAIKMIEAGADRLGTSGGVQIVEGKINENY
ncbi:deoxyribose-phosphate aldolase [Spiroplasma sabaudiense Ar-1343]|uniref:Deoxyribose-phosphate aldolase n=1 Tax=Spiroplasma sabaudiense Ar-1343 TaxID=1276257 RepID=W6AA94_9MOLU|nr:deoxyribose-phosphate aldolase [Spiroplasma sabaudiense]AHI53931.1 deoxyribose-phosphate aldolase [Spiroplasma sabaudiense Ar-1343]